MPETLLHVAGLILARGGSQGIPLKNITLLANHPLLVWSLGAMKTFGRFDSIWVSTDHPLIAQCASQMGVSVFHRCSKFAKCGSPSVDAVQEFLSAHPEVDIVGLVQCTSPFLQPEFLDKAYDLMIEQGYDSVFSVTRDKKLRWSETDFNDDEDTVNDEDYESNLLIQPPIPFSSTIVTNTLNNGIQNDSSIIETLKNGAPENCDKCCSCYLNSTSSTISTKLCLSSELNGAKQRQQLKGENLIPQIREDVEQLQNNPEKVMIANIDDRNENSSVSSKNDLDPKLFQVIEVLNSSVIKNETAISSKDVDSSIQNGCYNVVDICKSSIQSDIKSAKDYIEDNKDQMITDKYVMKSNTGGNVPSSCCCSSR